MLQVDHIDAKANYHSSVLLEVPNTQIFAIQNGKQTQITQGFLHVMQIQEQNLTFLQLNDFQYTLNKNVPIMTLPRNSNQDPKMYTLFMNSSLSYGVVVQGGQLKDIYDCFESILSTYSKLMTHDDKQSGQPQVGLPMQQKQLIIPNEIANKLSTQPGAEKRTSTEISEWLFKGSNIIKEGLITGASYLQQGIIKGGELLTSKIDKREYKQIDDSTKTKIHLANQGSKAIVTYTAMQVSALVQMGKVITQEASKEFESSETGRNLQANPNYAPAKEVGKATLYAFANIYDGLYEAVTQLGRGISQATTGVVQAKYGDQAAQVTKEGLDTVGNIGEFTQIYKNAISKEVIHSGPQ